MKYDLKPPIETERNKFAALNFNPILKSIPPPPLIIWELQTEAHAALKHPLGMIYGTENVKRPERVVVIRLIGNRRHLSTYVMQFHIGMHLAYVERSFFRLPSSEWQLGPSGGVRSAGDEDCNLTIQICPEGILLFLAPGKVHSMKN